MKSTMKNLEDKSTTELEKEVNTLREEIAKIRLDSVVNVPKDTNTLPKKTKQLARVLTVLSEKRSREVINK